MSQDHNKSLDDAHASHAHSSSLRRLAIGFVAGLASLMLAAVLAVIFTVVMAYPQLPSLDALTDYRPKIPLRVFSADNVLIGEFGEERRNLVRIGDVPDIMKKAVLAIEDDRFYSHSGVDYPSIVRAAMHNLTSSSRQGASTITQQVARNFFLSSEQTFKRKIYEALLALKIEQNLSKDQIFEIYLNQIYLGQRAYGFASAAQIYFGKPLAEINIAEAAMLAGLPKAPSAYNPVANPRRARLRQQYILQRMHQLGYISDAQYKDAREQTLRIKTNSAEFGIHAEYVAEMARQLVYEQFKDEAYTRGLNVHTTITKADQDAAYLAVRRGVMEYERRQGYRGPEAYIDIPEVKDEAETAIEVALAEHPDSDEIVAAVVLEASPKSVKAVLASGQEIEIKGAGLAYAANLLSTKAPPPRRVRRGAIIRVMQDERNWAITQLPEVEAAFVAANAEDGAIRALVGGFDFNRNKFNHVTQAWRQPGSAFKPFIYSAALEKGLSPATLINDAPISFDARQTGGQAWSPKNYDNKYDGPMTMRQALAKSKNMVSIRLLQKVGAAYGQEYAMRFGFDADRNPPYLTLALGAGAVTPLQMAGAYAVFANGGFAVHPYLISHITDATGHVLSQASPDRAGDEGNRVIDERNAFVMNSLMMDVVRHGTATRALSLKRPDIAGKTGTTNDSHDAWFAGYHPKIVSIAWIGFDQPRNLGSRETGGGLALPVWINYMEKVLKDVPVEERAAPSGVIQVANELYYSENLPGIGVRTVGLGEVDGALGEPARDEVKNELF